MHGATGNLIELRCELRPTVKRPTWRARATIAIKTIQGLPSVMLS